MCSSVSAAHSIHSPITRSLSFSHSVSPLLSLSLTTSPANLMKGCPIAFSINIPIPSDVNNECSLPLFSQWKMLRPICRLWHRALGRMTGESRRGSHGDKTERLKCRAVNSLIPINKQDLIVCYSGFANYCEITKSNNK